MMRSKFSDMIKQGVAKFEYTPIIKDTPETDIICKQYNNIFAMPTDTHMSMLEDGRRVITGSMIGTRKWQDFLSLCQYANIDFRPTGFYCFDDFLYKYRLCGEMGNLNGEVVYFLKPCETTTNMYKESVVNEVSVKKVEYVPNFDIRSDVYAVLEHLGLIYNVKGKEFDKKDLEEAFEWFLMEYFDN